MRSAVYDDNGRLGRIRGSCEATERSTPHFHGMTKANRSACETGGVEQSHFTVLAANEESSCSQKQNAHFAVPLISTAIMATAYFSGGGSYDINRILVETVESRKLLHKRYPGVQQRYHAGSISLGPHLSGKIIAQHVCDIRLVEISCDCHHERMCL